MIITVQARNNVTIPRLLRDQLKLEPGTPLEARVDKGSLVLTPVAVVPRVLRLSEKGEAKEREADEDIRQGRVTVFDSAEELLADLDG